MKPNHVGPNHTQDWAILPHESPKTPKYVPCPAIQLVTGTFYRTQSCIYTSTFPYGHITCGFPGHSGEFMHFPSSRWNGAEYAPPPVQRNNCKKTCVSHSLLLRKDHVLYTWALCFAHTRRLSEPGWPKRGRPPYQWLSSTRRKCPIQDRRKPPRFCAPLLVAN